MVTPLYVIIAAKRRSALATGRMMASREQNHLFHSGGVDEMLIPAQ